MSAGALAIVLFGSLFVFLFLGIPVGFALGMSALCGIIAGGTQTLGFLSQTMVAGCDSFPILAIPMFILAGEMMGGGGVSRRILNVFKATFGRMYGGLAICTVAFCMFFAAVSASDCSVSSDSTLRSRMPVRVDIHSSLVSRNAARSSFFTTFFGSALPVPSIFKRITSPVSIHPFFE